MLVGAIHGDCGKQIHNVCRVACLLVLQPASSIGNPAYKKAAFSMSMKNRFLKSVALVILCGIFSASPALAQEDIGSELPPEVRGLLIQEMIAILGATQNIINAMVRGDDALVADEAQQIHDSFILAQALTAEQKKALLAAASAEFLAKDEAFHALGAALADAARAGDKPRQQAIFNDMLHACVACHTDHAAQRFPGFSMP